MHGGYYGPMVYRGYNGTLGDYGHMGYCYP